MNFRVFSLPPHTEEFHSRVFQVVIGNFGLSHDQERAQMALWAIMASPMLVSADFRKMPASSKAILLNKYVISINQDPLGVQGRRIKEVRQRTRSLEGTQWER